MCSFHTGLYRPLYILPLSVMAGMKNGVCVVQGEVALLLSAMRRSSRWTGHARSVSEGREGRGSYLGGNWVQQGDPSSQMLFPQGLRIDGNAQEFFDVHHQILHVCVHAHVHLRQPITT